MGSNAQKASEPATLLVNPTSYDSLPSVLDSAQQVIVAQQANLQSLRQSTTSFQDSLRQVLTPHAAIPDSLPLLDSSKQILAKPRGRIETIKQRTTAVRNSATQKITRGISRLDTLPIGKDVRQQVVPKGMLKKVPSVSLELPTLATELPKMDKSRRSLLQLPAKQLPSEITDHSLFNKAKEGWGKKKGITDSLTNVKSRFREDQRLKQAKDSWSQIRADSLYDLSTLRDTLVSTGLKKGEVWAIQRVSKQLEGQLPEPLMAEHPQEDAMRSRLTEEARGFFGTDEEKLNQAKAQLTKLKKTYRQVKEQDSVFIKNTSLKGIPTRQRLAYGINVNPSKIGLSSWQLRSQLGYQLNKVWTLGLGGQFQVGIATKPIQVNVSWTGGYGFVQREVARQFLLYTEVAYETKSILNEHPERGMTDWKVWVGIGKQVSITGKLALQLLFLWDGLSDHRMPVRERLQFRIGVCKLSSTN